MSTQSNYNGNKVNLETLRIKGLDLSAGGYTHSLPEKSGTISHVSDLDDYLPLIGGTMSGVIDLDFNSGDIIKSTTASLSFNSFVDGINLLYNNRYVGAFVDRSGLGNFNTSFGVFDDDGTFHLTSDNYASSAILDTNGISGNLVFYFPNSSGTFSLTSDLDDYLPLIGGTMSGNIQFVDIGYIYTESVDTSVGINIIDGTDVSLQWNGTSSFTNLTINNTDSIPVTSTKPLFRGIEYNTDFSPNYTNRSLVDKEYTDGTVNRSKYAATFSFTAGVTQSINHGLNSYDIIISLWDYNTGYYIIGSYSQTSVDNVDIVLSISADVRVVVL
jgi:hypothetical protein